MNTIKIILSILLLACLINLPYGYYQFVRFAAFIGFSYLAYSASEKGYKNETFIYIALALLFQPFLKIALGRTIWNIVDVLVAIGLIVTIIVSKRSNNRS